MKVRHKYATRWAGEVLKYEKDTGMVYILWEKDNLLWKDWHLLEFLCFIVPAPSRKV